MKHEIAQVSSPAEAARVAAFFRTVWQDGEAVAPQDLILAAVHVGGYCAFIESGDRVVAASFGFLGSHNGLSTLHSHVTASTVPGLGYELKMHQRQWALANGLAAITWTFDPLIRRNCVFNFEKLGAKAVEYLPNFYGNMADSINLGDDSDRLFVVWPLEAETVIVTEEKMWVTIPEDIESLRQTDLEAALVWRTNVRQIMAPWFADGAVIRSINPERSAVLIERIAR